jgi:hypothetical protein
MASRRRKSELDEVLMGTVKEKLGELGWKCLESGKLVMKLIGDSMKISGSFKGSFRDLLEE